MHPLILTSHKKVFVVSYIGPLYVSSPVRVLRICFLIYFDLKFKLGLHLENKRRNSEMLKVLVKHRSDILIYYCF